MKLAEHVLGGALSMRIQYGTLRQNWDSDGSQKSKLLWVVIHHISTMVADFMESSHNRSRGHGRVPDQGSGTGASVGCPVPEIWPFSFY